MLEEGSLQLTEAARELQSGLARLEFDPERSAAIDARRSEVERLLARFGPGEEQLFTTRDAMRAELAHLTDATQSPAAIEAELARRLGELEATAAALTQARRSAAKQLSKRLASELADLGMERIGVEVRIIEASHGPFLDRATELGTSEVEVFLAPNPGEPLTPLSKTASGGEVARVMLALKKILADQDRVPVIVFDEADAEIGGRLGLAVGRKLKALAANHQVLCITHLPTIAAFADRHLMVTKRVEVTSETGERTVAELVELTEDARRRELASMARGESAVDRAALREAQRLRELAQGS
jgi:DNA repair protein RecN (Recombination protein N)